MWHVDEMCTVPLPPPPPPPLFMQTRRTVADMAVKVTRNALQAGFVGAVACAAPGRALSEEARQSLRDAVLRHAVHGNWVGVRLHSALLSSGAALLRDGGAAASDPTSHQRRIPT